MFLPHCSDILYIIIIIIIKSRWQERVHWLSLAIRPYHPSLRVGTDGCILCAYRGDVSRTLLVGQHWYVYVQESIRERHFWVRPCISIGILHVLFVLLEWFVKWEVSGYIVAVLWGVAFRIYSKQQAFYKCPCDTFISYYEHGYILEEISFSFIR